MEKSKVEIVKKEYPNINESVIDSILENREDKKYLLERYRKLENHIDWFVSNMELNELKNRQFMYSYLEERELISKVI